MPTPASQPRKPSANLIREEANIVRSDRRHDLHRQTPTGQSRRIIIWLLSMIDVTMDARSNLGLNLQW